MHDQEEDTLAAYGGEVIPALRLAQSVPVLLVPADEDAAGAGL